MFASHRRVKHGASRSDQALNLFEKFEFKLKKKSRLARSSTRSASYPFVTGDTFRACADIVIEDTPAIADYTRNNIGDHGLVFIEAALLKFLAARLDGQFRLRSRLVVHNGDKIDVNSILELSEIFDHVYSVNWLLAHPKVTPIPIGLENAHLGWNGKLSYFQKAMPSFRKNLVSSPRTIQILCQLNESTNSLKRNGLIRLFNRPDLGFYSGNKINRSVYFSLLEDCRFVVSPPGNGPDCHRTWEAIYFGAIPIVLKSDWPFGNLDLPVLVVNSWDEAFELVSRDGEELFQDISTKSADAAYFNYYARLLTS